MAKEIKLLKKKIEFESYLFVEKASGIFIERPKEGKKITKRELSKQVKEILMPLLDGVRRVSERPRKIEKLYFEIENLKKGIQIREGAISKVQDLINRELFKELLAPLEEAKLNLEKEKKNLEFEVEFRKRSLRKIEGEKKPFLNEMGEFVTDFFGTKGKNLFFAVLVLFVSFWSFMVLRNRLFGLLHLSKKFLFLKKTFMALYGGISFSISVFLSIMCLYFFNDWLLVTLACILILGILWSLKQVAPQFLDEARLILNLGTVREGEKIIFNGVPWKVETLNFLSTLTNESLSGGRLLVRARDMVKYSSRPWSHEENWFPTEKGDWVVLSDKTFGQVIIQTPDQVILKTLGGSQYFYKTENFMGLAPENLSRGVLVEAVLRLDYKYQKDVFPLIGYFQEGLEQKLKSRELFGRSIQKVMVEFNSLGEHALDLWIRVDAEGTIARERYTLERYLQRAFVELCNEKEMLIPFEQLSVHFKSNEQRPIE
ncbi:MAG: hypothetical protein VYD54_14895 [Bdellovibrionota bacterium]|nr:hypothetical protein [Bdellovibrionota bacterium]